MMKTTTTVVLMGAALLVARPAEADDASASVDVASAYIFRGATVVDDVVVQPALSGTFHGVAVGTWANYNSDTEQFDEIDFTLGYDLPLGDDAPVGLSIGYTEYVYPTAVDEEGAGLEADREVSLSASIDCLGSISDLLSPSVMVAYGIEGPFLEEGLHIALSAEHEEKISDDLTLGGSASVVFEEGDNFAENGMSYAQVGLSASSGAFSIGVDYIIETDDDVLEVDEDVLVTAGISLPL